MAETYDHGNYHDQDPGESSRLKQLVHSFGRAAGRALQMFGGPIPLGTFNPAIHAGRQEKEVEKTEITSVGRPVTLPATYDYDQGIRLQPVYWGRMYDKKGESVLPLELLQEHDTLIAIYKIDHEAAYRYAIAQKVPQLRTGEPDLEKVKFSIVYEYTRAIKDSPSRFKCKGTREATISDPELLESLIIGGNYGGGSRLAMVLNLTPQHEKTAFSGDSSNEERALSYSLYGVERALLEHEAKQLDKSK